MAKITIPDIASQFASQEALNARFQQIEDAINDDLLFRANVANGEPNEMALTLDMNLNRIINLPVAISSGEPVTLGQAITLINDINAGGNGNIGAGLYYSTEFIVLSAGQTIVSFSSDTTLSNFALSGLDVDNGKIFEGVDYDINHNTRQVTLYESYPAGTALSRYREGSDTQDGSNLTGVGNPEGVVTAGTGKIYTDSDGGVGSTLYVKETGTGNTGWAAK